MIKEEPFLAQIPDLRFERPIPGPRGIDDPVAGDGEVLHVTRKEFRWPAEITPQRVQRNVVRDETKFCLQRTGGLAQSRRAGHGATGQRSVQHHFERPG